METEQTFAMSLLARRAQAARHVLLILKSPSYESATDAAGTIAERLFPRAQGWESYFLVESTANVKDPATITMSSLVLS